MSDYPEFTPTTEQVRSAYAHDPEAEYRDPVGFPEMQRENLRAFDRWLAAHDAEVREHARHEFCDPTLGCAIAEEPEWEYGLLMNGHSTMNEPTEAHPPTDDERRVPSFAEREKRASAAWEFFARTDREMSHDFRGGYHQGVIDEAGRRSEVPEPPDDGFCDQCSGPFLAKDSESNRWLEEGYGGHWDTCRNRVDNSSAEPQGEPSEPDEYSRGFDNGVAWERDFGNKGEPSEVEFPFTHDGVTLEQDDGGLWVTINEYERPRWIGPKVLAALRAAGGVR